MNAALAAACAMRCPALTQRRWVQGHQLARVWLSGRVAGLGRSGGWSDACWGSCSPVEKDARVLGRLPIPASEPAVLFSVLTWSAQVESLLLLARLCQPARTGRRDFLVRKVRRLIQFDVCRCCLQVCHRE